MKRIAALLALLPASAFALVNVNTAQQSELAKTRGLDRYKAKSIIEYRAANGPIESMSRYCRRTCAKSVLLASQGT